MDKLIKYLSSKICEDIGSNYTKTAIAIYGNNPRSMSFFAFKKLDIK
jgi:hypothetical protein